MSGTGTERPDDPIARALAEWRERRDRGEEVSIDDLCRENPGIAEAIRARAAALEVLGRHLGADRETEAARALRLLSGDRYARFRTVGEGGMGIVYWAIDTDLNREVAFKIVRPDAGGARTDAPRSPERASAPPQGTPASHAFETLKARFLQEAWVTAGMSHPGIVPVYELGETPGGVPFYTMRFVRGNRTLAHAIEEKKDRPWEDRVALLEPFLKICDTISFAHAKGVVHRDIKPENVALGEFGEVVVLDWGLARIEEGRDAAGELWRERIEELRATSDLRTLASALGTPGYMSPEAALGRVAEVDAKSDVYSLGAILYRILTGKAAFEFASYGELVKQLMEGTPAAPREVDPSVPEALSLLALRALARNREARTDSASALAQEIRDWQSRSAADRECDALLRDAQAGLAAAELLRGADAAGALDLAATALTQAERVRPGDARIPPLRAVLARRRESAIAERERIAAGRTRRRAAVVGLAAAVIVATTFAFVLEGRRRETASARDEAARERDAKAAALADEQAARARADEESRRARTAGLANAAAERLRDAPQLALLLARESVRTQVSIEGVTRLHEALAECRERSRVDQRSSPLVAAAFLDGGGIVTAGHDGIVRVVATDGAPSRDVLTTNAPLTEFTVSPAGDRLACSSLDGRLRVIDAAGKLIFDVPGCRGWPAGLAWSADGSRLLIVDGGEGAAGKGARACVWSSSGNLLVTLGDDEAVPTAACFQRDGYGLWVGSIDGSVAHYDAAGSLTRSVPPESSVPAGRPVYAVQPLADGGVVWTDDEGRVGIAAGDGASVKRFRSAARQMPGLRASPDGRRFALVDAQGTFVVHEADGSVVREAPETHADTRVLSPVQTIAWTSEGRELVTTDPDGAIRLWSVQGGADDAMRGHSARATSVVFAPDGRLLSAGADGAAILWSRARVEDAAVDAGPGALHDVAWSGDGTRFAVSGAMGTLVADADGTVLARLGIGSGPRRRPEFLPGGRDLVDIGDSGAARWDLGTGERTALGGPEPVQQAVVLPGAELVVVQPWEGNPRIFGFDGRERAELPGHAPRATCMAPDAEGNSILTLTEDGIVRRWSLAGELLQTLTTSEGRAISVASTPDGTVAVGFMEAKALVWPRGAPVPLPPLRIGGYVVGLNVLSDGRRLLVESLLPTVTIVTADLASSVVLRGHTRRIVATDVSSDGSLVATGSEDSTARIWRADGSPAAILAGHANTVSSVAFSPDGSRLLTCSADGTARTWILDTDELLARADARATRRFRASELARYESLLGAEDRSRLQGERVAEETMSRLLLRSDAQAEIETRADLAPAVRAAAVAAIRDRPEDVATMNDLAWESARSPGGSAGSRDRAVRLARRAVELRGDVADYRNTLAMALLRAGDTVEAKTEIGRAAGIRPEGRAAACDDLVLAFVLAAEGATVEARAALDRAKAALASGPRREAEALAPLCAEVERLAAGK